MTKAEILSHCEHVLELKIQETESYLSDLQNSIQNESKSSAGDKHEVGRAMAQIEAEKSANQLKQLLAQRSLLDRIDVKAKISSIILGALIQTKQEKIFVSLALGETELMGEKLLLLSFQSPLIQALRKIGIGEKIEFNGREYEIQEIS